MSETPETLTSTPVATGPPSINGDASKRTAEASPATEAGTGDESKSSTDIEIAQRAFQEKAKSYLVDQQQHVVLPSFSAWFNLNDVHSIEKKLFPDFFPSKTSPDEFHSVYKTSEVYKNMRDFMINAYRVNPLEYLTVTAVRRNLAGDVTSIIRIHHFLEKWGLINYQIDPRTKSSVVGPQYTGHFQITLDTPSGLVPFVPTKVTGASNTVGEEKEDTPNVEVKEEASEEAEQVVPLNLEVRRNVYTKDADLSKNISIDSIQFFCNICGKECTKSRYHNLKVKSYHNNPNSTSNNAAVVCVDCFDQGLFPLNFYSSDFLKLKEEVNSGNTWTEQEVLLLLEGIEIYGSYDTGNPATTQNSNGQWDKIAEHVGTKSREECLVKFIQLPIEDRYLTKLSAPKKSGKNKSNGNASDKKVSTNFIEDIVKKIVSNPQASTAVSGSATKTADAISEDQRQLIDQILELTLEKVSIKLQNIDLLEQNLIEQEKKIQDERKQVLYERWSQFEKINKYKQAHPELSVIFDDLLTPVKVQEFVKVKRSVENKEDKNGGENNDGMDIDLVNAISNGSEAITNPISLSKPKSYQFWSG